MAEIQTTIDREQDLTVQTVKGELTSRELLDALASYYAGEPTRNILWDLTEAKLERLTSSEVRALAQATVQYAHQRVGGKTALVLSSAFAYGMGRMFDQSRNVSGAPVDHMSFLDRAAALAWLGGG